MVLVDSGSCLQTHRHPKLPVLWLQGLGANGIRLTMESALTARDRVGVQDFVLLENFTSEAAFIENLRKRFKENLIYVSSTGTAAQCPWVGWAVAAARDKP